MLRVGQSALPKSDRTAPKLRSRRQRADPVVSPEGPAAGGGGPSTAVDPGVPLGPGLIATCLVFHGPHVRSANPRINPATINASVPPLIEPFPLSRSPM